MANYYAQRKWVKNGQPQTPQNYPYDNREAADVQWHLLCAKALRNDDSTDMESVELGTIEHGAIKREFYDHTPAVVEPEEPEVNPEEVAG